MIGLLLLLACSPAETNAAPVAGLPAAAQAAYVGCADYAGVPAAHAVCLSKAALTLGSATDVDALCGQAGESEASCRRLWATHPLRMETVPRSELLAVCGRDADCAFQVLDARPEPALVDQAPLCLQHVAPYLRDCVGHAIERWIDTRPSEAEIAAMYTALPSHVDLMSSMVGRADACGGKVHCGAGETAPDAMCRRHAEDQRRRDCR